jgi:hypothetical protein
MGLSRRGPRESAARLDPFPLSGMRVCKVVGSLVGISEAETPLWGGERWRS